MARCLASSGLAAFTAACGTSAALGCRSCSERRELREAVSVDPSTHSHSSDSSSQRSVESSSSRESQPEMSISSVVSEHFCGVRSQLLCEEPGLVALGELVWLGSVLGRLGLLQAQKQLMHLQRHARRFSGVHVR